MAISYQRNMSKEQMNEVRDALEAYVHEGDRKMLAAILEEAINAFMARHRYERGKAFRFYRHDYLPP